MLKNLTCQCTGTTFEKEGRIWTCDHCGAEHLLNKDLTTVIEVYSVSQKSIHIRNAQGVVIGNNLNLEMNFSE